jgi:hypothetical protein
LFGKIFFKNFKRKGFRRVATSIKCCDDVFVKKSQITQFHVGDNEINMIKVGGVPCDRKRNIKWLSIGLRAKPHGNFCGSS